MKKRWTIREAALLLLPVAALTAYGLWMSKPNVSKRPPSRPNNRLGFTVQSIEVVPATPRDVYEGYDTVVKVKYNWPSPPKLPNAIVGAKSNDCLVPWLTYKARNKAQRVKTEKDAIRRMVFVGSNRVEFRMNLSKVPMKYGELTLKSAIWDNWLYNVTGAGGKVTVKVLTAPSIPISVVVRKAGERVAPPEVSKRRPFIIKSIAHDSFLSFRGGNGKTIKITFENLQPTKDARWYFANPHLVDARGKEYIYAIRPGATGFSWAQMSYPADHLVDQRFPVRWFSFPLDLIPKSAGKITFKTEVSLDDCWPLPISYVVRP